MSDVHIFEQQYRVQLEAELTGKPLPSSLVEQYYFESCLVKNDKKELYLVRRKSDQARGMLRITKYYPEEDAFSEAEILSRIKHRAIPKLYAAFKYAGYHYMVREYFEGQTLHTVVKMHGPMPLQEVYRIVLQLCDVLEYLHMQTPPIIHRDIKPHNLIVTPEGHVKLIDFGIARHHKPSQSKDTRIILTDYYAPPEQYGFNQTTTVADIYSLGMTMLFMCTGQEDKALLAERVEDVKMKSLIQTCTAFDPNNRFSSVQNLRAQILRTGTEKASRKGKKKTLLMAVGVIACVALLGIGSVIVGSKLLRQIEQKPEHISAIDWFFSKGKTPFMGNLPGNVNNGGYATFSKDTVFFYKGVDIYTMDYAGTSVEKLTTSDSALSHLAYNEGVLYYSSGAGIFRADPISGETTMIVPVSAEGLYIRDGYIYFKNREDFLHLYRMKLDGTSYEQVNDLSKTIYMNLVDDYMYYADGSNDYQISRADIDGSNVTLIHARGDWLQVHGGYIYYYSGDDPFGLKRCDTEGKNDTLIYPGVASFINVTDQGIFYKNEDNKIQWTSLDGETSQVLCEERVAHFVIGGDWIIFTEAGGTDLYRMRMDGSEISLL